jgi:hypothetical protein
MQYKIPIQIENEDPIVLGLSMRQLTVMMMWGGLAYTIFKSLETQIGPQGALIVAAPFAIIGIIIALVKIAEMTFLPVVLNFFRLRLNSRERKWSMGCDGYSDMEVGYVSMTTQKASAEANKSIETTLGEDLTIQDKIGKL